MRQTRLLAALAILWLAGCASIPPQPADNPAAPAAADTALDMLGRPYRYGGDTPRGFDCSGLVYYSYARAGIKVPRSTELQYKQLPPVHPAHIKKGDLLFFDQLGRKTSHVGIYLGDRNFVHAPTGGKHVRLDSLNDPFWRKHFVEARRVPAN